QQITLEGVAQVLEPALHAKPSAFPDWTSQLDTKLRKMNECNSLEELQDSGGLVEAREMKTAAGEQYFQPAYLVAFTRFNFLARRAFFRAMHLDLHAIRAAVNELERMGFNTLDCREAGLSECESLEQVRHVIHQWKTPFRAPYSGGSSFLQLILLRHALELTLEGAGQVQALVSPQTQGAPAAAAAVAAGNVSPAAFASPSAVPSPTEDVTPVQPAPHAPRETQTHESSKPAQEAAPDLISNAHAEDAHSQPAPEAQTEQHHYLVRCVADITEQLQAVPAKNSPAVSAILLGGCKLLIATWEAQAFSEEGVTAAALQRTVAARTILHVCMERHKKNEATDLGAALDI